MSTLEKFGILVILVLVVIIGVVAVWGVGGGEESPFDATGPGGDATTMVPDPALGDPTQPTWPDNGAPAVAGDAGTAPVAPPNLGSGPSPASGLSAGPGVLAPASGGMKYRIKSGDTLAGISKSTLGDSNRWKDIVAANPGLDPRRLKIGTEIVIPSGGTSVASAPPAPSVGSPKPPVKSFSPNPADGPTGPEVAAPVARPAASGFREVEVRSGDTLYEISRRELGNPNLYYKIVKANPDLDPKRLKAGQKVRIPTDG